MIRRIPMACVAALALTAAVLAARLMPAPALIDPAGGVLPTGVRLDVPGLYLLLAPLFAMWDGVALLSKSRMEGFLLGTIAAYVLWRIGRRWVVRRGLLSAAWREAAMLVLAVTALAAFVLGGALWHRPMVTLAGVPASHMTVDFHTHTDSSRDVRGTLVAWYDLEANRRWHERAGYDVAFITDHNRRTLDAPSVGAPGMPVLCPGSEIGAYKSHVVLLGAGAENDRDPYERELDGLLRLLRESRLAGTPAILSIPEFERNHRDRLDELIAAGAAGLEISNGSPKANEITGARRDTVVAIAQAHDAAVVGVSDHHGWGATAMTWSLLARPAGADGGALCDAAVSAIVTDGYQSVQIAERHRVAPDAWWPQLLTPVAVIWEGWRSMGWPLTLAWLAWIWLVALVSVRAGARSASRPTHTPELPRREPALPAA
jgi:predicted metal-dependent phosphoesterase TrpH